MHLADIRAAGALTRGARSGATLRAGATRLAESGVEVTGAHAINTFPLPSSTNATAGPLTCMSPGAPKYSDVTPAMIG